MEKNVFSLLLFAILSAFLISSVSAEILISQPSSLYSLGDIFSAQITLKPSVETNSFLSAKIVCDNGEIEIYKSAYSVKPSESKNLTIEAKLDSSVIENVNGACVLHANFGSENAESQSFEISKIINVYATLSSSLVNPGEEFTILGTAKKTNSQNVNGFAKITFSGNNVSIISAVNDGIISNKFSTYTDTAAGLYKIYVNVYEKDSSGSITNSGSDSLKLNIRQLVKKIDLALTSESAKPESNLSFTVLLLDQSNAEANFESLVSVYDSNNNTFRKKIVKSGQSEIIEFPFNAPPGYWTIDASYQNSNVKRTFQVESVEKASFSLVNQTLIIKNMGNVQYVKEIEIVIGDEAEIKKVDLSSGEEKRFKLSAPDGDYSISVNEGSNSNALGSSFLTGRAISVRDLDSLTSDPKVMLWFWIIVIVILFSVAILYYRRVRSKSYVGKTPALIPVNRNDKKFIPITEDSFPVQAKENKDKKMQLETYGSPTMNMQGNKEEVAVISVKIKNSGKLQEAESSAFSAIEHSLQTARAAKAKVYDQGLFKIIVFSPTLTKKIDLENVTEAVKIAYAIQNELQEFNKKHAIKIDYGLGVNIGEMFLEIVEGKPKFTTSGNTTILAKNISEKANNSILLSSITHRKVYNIVKGESFQGLFKVNSILDRSQHSQFISRFMKKQDKK